MNRVSLALVALLALDQRAGQVCTPTGAASAAAATTAPPAGP